jgi:hypothetical protein
VGSVDMGDASYRRLGSGPVAFGGDDSFGLRRASLDGEKNVLHCGSR